MTDLPWLEYSGQSTEELLAAAETHREDSLNSAFEWGIQAKLERGLELSAEETLVLAVEALVREVNNGGYHQFFTNSSHQFAPIIVESLNRIGATEAAGVSAEAIAALGLAEVSAEAVYEAADSADDEVMAALDGCDQRYYTIPDLDGKLFAFIRANAERIRI